jgi:hypothetical protein
MSDLLNGTPCQYCRKYYGHTSDCFSNTQTGIAEKMMFLEIERRHSMICHNLEAKLKIAVEALERILDTYKNGTWTANLVSRKALEKLKVGDEK